MHNCYGYQSLSGKIDFASQLEESIFPAGNRGFLLVNTIWLFLAVCNLKIIREIDVNGRTETKKTISFTFQGKKLCSLTRRDTLFTPICSSKLQTI
jgi:hypothetical protein